MVQIDKIEYRKHTLCNTPQPDVDMNIIEYFYAATWEDIMGDDSLVDLIMNNGYYKTALCCAFQIERMTLDVNGTKWKLCSPPRNISSQLEFFQGKTEMLTVGVNLLNSELKNINVTTPLVER